MKKNKGFTLIELLAIIVILAIIAVITIPILLNVIENSRKGAATDSAYGYKDSINKYYVTELSSNRQLQLEGDYTVTNGVLSGSGVDNVTIPVSGTVPKSGTLTYSNNTLTNGCLVIGEYAVTFTGSNVTSTEKGECGPNIAAIIEALPGTENEGDGYKYIESDYVQAHPVYYNPTTGAVCDSSDAVSTTGTTTGCLKWYAYSVKDGVVNMILDHNINPSGTGVAWVSEEDYGNGASLGETLGVTNMGSGSYGYPGNNDKGPLTALKYLKENTSGWTTSVQGDYATYTAKTDNAKYSINYSGYKARLITAQEVANITGASDSTSGINFNEISSSNYFYLDGSGSNWQTNNNVKYKWLYENLISESIVKGLFGFWSSSPVSGRSFHAWYVNAGGNINYYFLYDTDSGIRPVITVSSSVVFS